MAVDDARHQVFAGRVDYARVHRRFEVFADGRDFSFNDEHVGILQSAVRDREYSGVANERFRRVFSAWLLGLRSAGQGAE